MLRLWKQMAWGLPYLDQFIQRQCTEKFKDQGIDVFWGIFSSKHIANKAGVRTIPNERLASSKCFIYLFICLFYFIYLFFSYIVAVYKY